MGWGIELWGPAIRLCVFLCITMPCENSSTRIQPSARAESTTVLA